MFNSPYLVTKSIKKADNFYKKEEVLRNKLVNKSQDSFIQSYKNLNQ